MNNPSYYNFKVYHDDTDFLGIMYHSNHLKYFERGRTNLLSEYGQTHASIEKEFGVLFVVHSLNIKYLRPIYLQDACIVETEIKEVLGPKLIFHQTIKKHEISMSELQVNVVTIDRTFKLRPVPKSIFSN